ncbi:MAG TPA: alpha/beta hydrolase family protein [Thermoleophilaceae bacterium]|nr:alpha/beta hydrolase family protein [Thermoleophilaceae bacterium]
MRVRALIAATVAVALVPVGSADAARLVRFTTKSGHVDAREPKTTFNEVHRDGLPRPQALPVNVMLPDGYDGKRRFPVLFLLHGHGDTYDSWADPRNGDIMHLAAGLPAIVVMPEGGRGWYLDWWSGGRRAEPGWESYHLDELLPLVLHRFRVRRGRRWHAIAGLSMGGEGAMYYATQRPGFFGSVASFSGPLSIQRPEWPSGFDTQGEDHNDVFGDPAAQEFYWAGHNPTALVGNLLHTRVFVAVGDGNPVRPDDFDNAFGQVAERDLRQHAEDFVNAAEGRRLDVTYDPLPGIHDWPYWRQHLTDAMHWGLFGRVPSRSRRWEFTTVSRHSRAWAMRFDFVKAPTTLAEFRRAGKVLSARGAGTVRVRFPRGAVRTLKLPFSVRIPGAK